MRNRFCWMVPVLLLAAPSLVRADVAPPSDYVEKCTVARQQKPGEHCEARRAWHQDYWGCGEDKANLPRDKEACGKYSRSPQKLCCKGWLAAGWKHRCKSRGASVFKMVWCRPRVAGDPPKPPVVEARKRDGCSLPVGQGSEFAGLPLLLGLLLVLWLRIKRD